MKTVDMVLHILASGNAGGIETLCKDYVKHSNLDHIFVFVWGGGSIANEMKEFGANVVVLNASKKNILGPAKKLRELCKKYNICSVIVHHAAPVNYIYAMLLKRKFKNLQIYVYAHGSAEDMCRVNRKGFFFRKIILKRAIAKSKSVIAISNSVKESLIDFLAVPVDKITVIYNGTAMKGIPRNMHKKNEIPELIYVGRLIEEKGVQNTIKGLSRIREQFHFTIVGDGAYREELKKSVEKLGLSKKITFLGSRRDIRDLLSKSDVFIHLPIWNEGFGIAVIEAMSMGLCCICNNSGAMPEIITNEINGFIVEKNNIDQFVEQLNYVLQNLNNTKVLRIQKSAIETAKNFTIDVYARKLDGVLFQ